MGEGTGEANALYWLRRGEHVWVLRRPPAVINASGASDMNREWRILAALEGTGWATAASGTVCGASPRRSGRWAWRRRMRWNGRRSVTCLRTGRGSSGCSPTAAAGGDLF